MIRVVVDSTADIPPDLLLETGIVVVPILLQFGRETVRDTEISRDEVYRRMVESSEVARTASPSVGMFEETFRALTANGDPVLSISLAGDLSGTYGAAQQAARLVEGARIVCVDSRTTTMAMGHIALAAARAAGEGQSLEQLAALVGDLSRRAVLYVALDTLTYLEKGGRIGRMRALLGAMLSVKPVLEVRDGAVLPVEQVRTWRRVPPRLVELMSARGPFESLTALYTTGRENAEAAADLCAAAGLAPREQIRIVQAGPALGTHAGPGALGIAGLLK